MGRQIVEGVGELATKRRIGMAEANIVGGDQVEALSQHRHEVAEHLAAGRQAVQQQDRGRGGVASLAVEDLAAFHIGGSVIDAGGHWELLRV